MATNVVLSMRGVTSSKLKKRPFDGIDMDPDFNGRRLSTEQDRRTSTRGDNFQRSLHHRQEDSGGHGRTEVTEPPHDNYRIQSPPDFPSRPFARRTRPVSVSRVHIMLRVNKNLQ